MKKRDKIIVGSVLVLLVAALALFLVLFFGKSILVSGETYSYNSSLRDYEIVEEIVIDGKKDDSKWENINPYVRTTSSDNRDMSKYEIYENQIEECKAEVYTYLGEGGFFVYANTDDPVVNTTVLSPLATTAFDFYFSSRDSLATLDTLFNFAISCDNNVKIRVRATDNTTGKVAWMSRPNVGVVSEVSVNNQGYSVEIFIPWSTLNLDEKPEYVQMATALSRRVDESYEAARTWEMFDFYTGPISMTNSATFPLFDKNGYIEFATGENFGFIHSNIIDLSEDKGSSPKVTTLNQRTVTAFLDEEAVKNVYWETTIKIDNFNYTDDPRVGIVLRSEKTEEGNYDQVYLLFQLDKNHEGEGYTIKNLIMLPSTNKANTWTDSQWYNLNSHIENKEFKLAIMKQNGKFYFYLDDVLLAVRDSIGSFTADTKVTCGITSWYTGATFSDYKMTTSGLDAIKAKKASYFVADENYTAINIDTLTQSKGYIWGRSTVTNQSTVNFNQNISSTFCVSTMISDLTSYKEAKDARQGIMLTKDLGNGKYRRMFFALTGGENDSFDHLQVYMFDNDDLGDGWKNVTSVSNAIITQRKSAELTISVKNNKLSFYLDGKYISTILLSDYGMENPTAVGLSSWKGSAKFSNIGMVSEVKDASSITTDVGATKSVLPLNDTASADIYAETTVKVIKSSTTMWPRAGLRVTNEAGENIDFVLNFNKEEELIDIIAVPVDVKGADDGTRQTYKIASVLEDAYKDGVQIAVAKSGNTFYFYVNDVLLGTKTYDNFGANDKVITSLYTKVAECTFTDYSAKTAADDIKAEMEAKTDLFVADAKKTFSYFDLFDEENKKDAKVTTNENGAWKNSSIVNWNGVLTDKFYAETTVELNNSHASGSAAGLVLSSGDNRLYVLFTGTEEEIIRVSVVSMTKDIFDNYNAEKYPEGKVYELNETISLEGENKIAVYRDGNQLYVIVNDELQKVIDMSAVTYPITDACTVGLTGWKAAATFTGYSIKTGEETPAIVSADNVPLTDANLTNWAWNVAYDEKANTLTFNAAESVITKNQQILTLHETAVADLYVETILKTSETSTSVWPRAGLRLTNSDGENVDFVIAFTKESTPTYNELFAIRTTSNGTDISGTKQKYSFTSIKDEISDGVKLAIAKKGDILYFYVNDVLQATKAYEGFGANDTVTANLYSKGTTSTFSDYSVSTDVDAAITDKTDIFVADANKSTIFFDVLNEANGTVTTDETGTWKDSSIVNWYGISSSKFYAETTVEMTKSNANGSQTGLVLTSGDNRFFILLYGTPDEITYLQGYSMTQDVMDNYNAENYPNGKVTEFSKKVSLTGENKLATYRNGNQLIVLLNDAVVTTVDLSKVAYPITDTCMVGFTGWKAAATFTDYSIVLDDACPTVSTPGIDTVVTGWDAKGSYNADKNAITMETLTSDAGTTTHVQTLDDVAKTDLYVETLIETQKASTKYWPRVGLRLTNESGKNVDFVIGFPKAEEPALNELFAIQTDASSSDISGTKKSFTVSTDLKASFLEDGIKLAIAKQGNTLYFFVNDVLYGTKTYEGFGANDKVTASLYSKVTESTFSDYTVSEYLESDITKANDVVALHTEPETSFHAETTIVVNEASTSVWPRVGLRLTNAEGKNVDVAFTLTKNATPTLSELYAIQTNASGSDISGTKNAYTVDNAWKQAISGDGVKLGVTKSGNTFYIYVNDVLVGNVNYADFGADVAVTAKLYSKGTNTSFSDYSYEVIEGVTSDISKATDVTSLNATAIADIYAETTIKVTDTSTSMWPRVGLRVTNSDGKNVDFVIAFLKNKTIESCFSIQTTATGSDTGSRNTFTLTDDQKTALTSTGLKMAVAKKDGVLYFFLADQLMGQITYDGFGANDTVTAKLYSKGTASKFTNYQTATPGATIPLVADANSSRNVTQTVAISSANVANIKIAMTGTSTKHGYMYFGNKSTKVYAETYVDFTSTATSGDNRVGLSLIDVDGNGTVTGQLGLYLHATGTGNVDKLEVFTNTSDDAVSWSAKSVTLSGIGRTGIKLAVLRDGDNFYVYINDSANPVYSGTLSTYTSFGITATTECYIGLNAMQKNATYYNYTYAYGDAVDALNK